MAASPPSSVQLLCPCAQSDPQFADPQGSTSSDYSSNRQSRGRRYEPNRERVEEPWWRRSIARRRRNRRRAEVEVASAVLGASDEIRVELLNIPLCLEPVHGDTRRTLDPTG